MCAAYPHLRSRRASLAVLLLTAAAAPALLAQNRAAPACAADNGGLTLPKGFCAVLVAEGLASPRHLAVAPNGDIFVALNRGGVGVLRDTSGDGKADIVATFYEGPGGSGIALASDAVYFAPNDRVVRLPWKPGELAPSGPAETIATGLPTGGHTAKGIVLGPNGALFVSFGSAGNMCQPPGSGTAHEPGLKPCMELEERAGVWRFDARRLNQTPADAKRWATGLRNPMAVSIQPGTGALYAGVHGRDNLAQTWGFSEEEGAENPAEVVFALPEGTNGGWPYCYFDSRKKVRLQNPEYGGDGSKVGDCDRVMAEPAVSFPGHWAPNATLFYGGSQFPARYRGGLFVAFHGSWNRAPRPQEGYRVVFVPFDKGKPSGSYEMFASPTGNPLSIRPSGLAVGPDGSLYIGADSQGKIWRVMYRP
jgi:glucose/arabinose dehydrogenase